MKTLFETMEALPLEQRLKFGKNKRLRRLRCEAWEAAEARVEARFQEDRAATNAETLKEAKAGIEEAKRARYLEKVRGMHAEQDRRAMAKGGRPAGASSPRTAGAGQDYTHPMDYLGPGGLDAIEDWEPEHVRKWGMAERDGTPDLWEVFGSHRSAWRK